MTPRPAAPLEFTFSPRALSSLAEAYSLEHRGPDREIVTLGGLRTRARHRSALLTYATSPAYVAAFVDSDLPACIVHSSHAALAPQRSLLVTEGAPGDAFYTIFSDLVASSAWSSLSAYRGARNDIADTARIHDSVVIGDDCVIMDNVVVLPGTYIADRVTIKPNATLGGDGFQLSEVRGRSQLIPHAGGVYIGCDVTIGSQTCIDRGLFGDLTWIDDDAHVDNLVHIAHSVTLGKGVVVVACAEISGSVAIADGAWLGPSCAINPGLSVGPHAQIGTGSTVVADIPAFAVAYGTPARVASWRCICGTRLVLSERPPRCSSCGRCFRLDAGRPIAVEADAC